MNKIINDLEFNKIVLYDKNGGTLYSVTNSNVVIFSLNYDDDKKNDTKTCQFEPFYSNPKHLLNSIYHKVKLKRTYSSMIGYDDDNQKRLQNLSSSILENICSYLCKEEIGIFKIICSKIALVCLKEMKKKH